MAEDKKYARSIFLTRDNRARTQGYLWMKKEVRCQESGSGEGRQEILQRVGVADGAGSAECRSAHHVPGSSTETL